MIVSCPSCGTHYRHQAPPVPVRARCGRCDAAFDLSALRPYRIVRIPVGREVPGGGTSGRLPIGLDEPGLAATIAANAAASPGPRAGAITWRAEAAGRDEASSPWDESDPLPPIPEMRSDQGFEPAVPRRGESDILDEGGRPPSTDIDPATEPSTLEATAGTLGLWVVGGAVLGTGASWTLGGTTVTGVLAGSLVGLTASWGWLRWTARP